MVEQEMTWRLLGPVTAEGSGGPVDLAARPRGVLLALLTQPNEVVSTARLAYALWGEEPPKSANNSIARFVADLRRSLGTHSDRVETGPGGYRLSVQPRELDVDRARAAHRRATELAGLDDHDGALTAARGGLGWFGAGPNTALADLRDTGAVLRNHEELEIGLRELIADLQIRRGAHQESITELEEAVDLFPYHERFWAQLMLALYRSGRQAEALAACQRLVSALVDIGLEPSPPVRRLEAEILGHGAAAPDALAAEQAPAVPVARARFGLPEPRTSFVGREVERQVLLTTLEESRMVTVVGLGGCGKTRIAQAAADAIEDEGGAVFRVGLRPMTDPALLLPAIADVFGVPAAKATDAGVLVDLIGHQPFLLLLDNCEHLTAGVSAAVEAILDGAPDGRVLATSRRPLGVSGERAYRLQPLDVPAPGAVSATLPAVVLFLERARAHQPNLVPDGDALLDIGATCRALGGLPIAIELAAAQMAHLAPADLLDRLSEPLGPAALDSASPRARLVSVMDWSWDALAAEEQALLARLSVFGDSWTLEAATAVCGTGRPVVAELARLVETSLVTMDPSDGRARYSMLETVRDYATRRLADRGETVERKDRLVEWLFDLTEPWGLAELYSWADAIDVLEPEHVNLLAGLGHLRSEGRSGELAWLAVRAGGMWTQRGFPGEVVRWLGAAVESPALSDEVRSAAAAALMDAASAMSDPQSVVAWGARSLELADGRAHDWVPHVAGVLGMLGLVFAVPMTTDELYELSLRTARASASRATNLALAEVWRAHVDFGQREYDAAISRFRVARSHCQERGRILLFSEVGVGLALYLTGEVHPGRRAEAVALASGWRSQASTDEWHYLVDVARAVIDGGGGRPQEATRRLAAAVRALRPAGVWSRANDYQVGFGMLADFRGEPELADALLSVAAPGNPLLLTTAIEHIGRRLGRDGPMGWRLTAMELLARALPEDPLSARGEPTATPDLIDWWAAGDVGRGLEFGAG